MSYYELKLPPEVPKRDAVNGRFLPGHSPHNKGKKWADYAGKRAQKRMAKGWKNLDLYRNKNGRSDVSGKCRKEIIAVDDEGNWLHFNYSLSAAQWIGACRENINRCCRFNQKRHKNKRTGRVNTDHKVKGVRFYFENDPIWCKKIKQQ